MALLTAKQVFKTSVQTVQEFAKSLEVSSSAIYYAINNDLIDHTLIGDNKFVVLTQLTRQYRPNAYPAKKPIKKRRKK